MLLDGVDLTSVWRSKRFQLPPPMLIETSAENSQQSLATA